MSKSSKVLKIVNEARLSKEVKRNFIFSPSLFPDTILKISTTALNPERAYNDRDVYFELLFKSDKDSDLYNFNTWITGEKCIELGMILIESGNDALNRSRLSNYETIELLAASSEANRNRYKSVIITKQSDEQPENYGGGFHYYDIYYKADDDLYSRKINDVVIHWSPFEKEFKEQLKKYTFGLEYKLVNFSYDEVKAAFDKFRKMHEKSLK
ncbi:MAG: hypothetical protein DRG78_09435 [Epsilonproteobacteria bacterium]|nr:MAG: hypothetical protein DRG78_09435 [Campylobacterota bacterium]